jgi:competence protein ComEC
VNGSDTRTTLLAPLWGLATGSVIGSAVALACPFTGVAWIHRALVVVGVLVTVYAASTRRGQLTWAVAGVALALGRGLPERSALLDLERLSLDPHAAIRATVVVVDGWRPSRWGVQAQVDLLDAHHGGVELPWTGRSRLEVRGEVGPDRTLPAPGTRVEVLAAPRGPPHRLILVTSSPRLLRSMTPPSGVHALRDVLARSVVASAGTDVRRIRAAELAGALVLGRRDLVSQGRLDGWRRSGLAHMLAVSGLHVGLVGGAVWLTALALGTRIVTARVAVLLVLPLYTIVAGAPPSAVRAAMMGMVYLIARLGGRALQPMAAVLLTASALVLLSPALLVAPGFQLTVLVTAALVRWTPALAARLPGPRWLAAMVAVPIVAQLAAMPLVIVHFRQLIPGAVLANLLAPLLLTPMLMAALLAVAGGTVSQVLAQPALELVAVTEQLLWSTGAVARASTRVAATMPGWWIVVTSIAGWFALQPGREARRGVAAWAVATIAAVAFPLAPRLSSGPGVVLLEVPDGLSAYVWSPRGSVLVDGGRSEVAAVRELADLGVRKADVVIATHTDADHLTGLVGVLRDIRCSTLLIPSWARSDPNLATLCRTAGREGVAVRAVARGSVASAGDLMVEVVWPASRDLPAAENERSLVIRVVTSQQEKILIPADVGARTERQLVTRSPLQAPVLIVPHHGSRDSSSDRFLDAVAPRIALIPAGPHTTHGHPHDRTLEAYAERGVAVRWPGRDGRCGAVFDQAGWRPFP